MRKRHEISDAVYGPGIITVLADGVTSWGLAINNMS